LLATAETAAVPTAVTAAVPVDESGFASRRILVVDPQEIVCSGLRALLCRQPWVARCNGATDREAARELAFRYEPHVALIDLLVGDESGVEISQAILEISPATRIVFMSGSGRISESCVNSDSAPPTLKPRAG
jgi:DNA-binding NtrC family response regulator